MPSRPMQILLALSVTLAVSACTGPQVFILHSPMQPDNTQQVTYTATASDSDGVKSIEIWEDLNTFSTCSNGMQCATNVSTTRLTTCNFSPAQNNATCTFTTAAAYPDSSFVGYRMVALDTQGTSSAEGWIYYAAGAFPWPDNPIPIYSTGEPAKKIDLIFIPDPDYNGNNTQFVQDVTDLVTNGYLSTQPFATEIRVWRGYWNFYVTFHTGDAQGYGSGCNQTPDNWGNLRTIIDSGGIVHTAALRDCGGVGDGSLFSTGVGANQTAIHETGHSVLSEADEYCCDGGYWETNPEGNVFNSLVNCQNNASNHGWSTSDCTQVNDGAGTTVNWWRSDGNNDLMATGNRLGRSDQERIYWLYFEQCDGAPGC